MKRVAVALAAMGNRIASGFGLEGAFLGLGTACLAIGAGMLNPAGPWLVIGAVGLIGGIALAWPRKV